MAKKTSKSALHEIEGILQPKTTNDTSINKIKLQRKRQPTVKEFVAQIRKGNVTYLSRAITLIESTNPKHYKKAEQIINECLPFANQSIRIGITGVPGVGKSTFIETFGKTFTKKGSKVAVLAVDPSSSLNKGSILGDKTRMEELVRDKNAFIRPSPSGNSLGGVAQKTRESIVLCEAAGYDVIFIETVGVGQSETSVRSMVDFFLLLKLAGAGDELQGIKRGIIEMADAIVINKADNDNIKRAKLAKNEFSRALHLFPEKESGWTPRVSTCSAIHNKGIDDISDLVDEFIKVTKSNGYFEKQRSQQNEFWLRETIEQQLKNNFYNHSAVKKALKKISSAVIDQKTTPFQAAKELLRLAREE